MGYVARMNGVVVERRPSLPWTRSTLRLPQGQHCTSRDHEEGPCNEHSTQNKPLYDVRRMNAHRRPTIHCSQPWISEPGVTEAEQMRNFHEFKRPRLCSSSSSVRVCSNAHTGSPKGNKNANCCRSYCFMAGAWGHRDRFKVLLCFLLPTSLVGEEGVSADHHGWCSASHLVWSSPNTQFRALPQQTNMQTRRGLTPDCSDNVLSQNSTGGSALFYCL